MSPYALKFLTAGFALGAMTLGGFAAWGYGGSCWSAGLWLLVLIAGDQLDFE